MTRKISMFGSMFGSHSYKIFLILTGLTFLISGCYPEPTKYEGEVLAEKYCVSCHSYPSPSLLSKEIWQEILPNMGAKMGFYVTPLEKKHMQLLKANNMLLDQPMIKPDEWRKIQEYIMYISPDSLAVENTEVGDTLNGLFRARPVSFQDQPPSASLVSFGKEPNVIWYGSYAKNNLIRYSIQDGLCHIYKLDGSPSCIHFDSTGFEVLTMGKIIPNDFRQGKLFRYQDDSLSRAIKDLPRPVHFSEGDLNGDGLPDRVISGFGFMKGELAWYERSHDGYVKHILRYLPGAIKTDIVDFNQDGNPDILALMAQADEGFFLYEGDGHGKFTGKRLLTFPPSWGSSYYELADMNNDGYQDIVYVCGDNGDYSHKVLKPYHGVRIFLQQKEDGDVQFKESYFYHMNGPYKAMADDYDGDGDIDIACISYFPDYQNTPEESFIYLENRGGNFPNFTPRHLKEGLMGKWLTADRGDFDHDGDIDIVLGNSQLMSLDAPKDLKRGWKDASLNILLLENKTH